MRLKEKLDSPFPFYLDDDRRNVLFISGMSVFVFVFLLLFKTSNENHLELTTFQKAIFGGVTFISLFFTIVVLPKIRSAWFDAEQWNVRKYILHTLLNIIIIGVISTAVDELYICPERSLWTNLVHATQQVVVIGSIPVALVTLILRNNLMRKNLRNALQANQELERINHFRNEATVRTDDHTNKLTLKSDTSETLDLHLPDLLFIRADDNYVAVYWSEGSTVHKKLLRVNLKSIENQINNAYAFRCHRSYIVNIASIAKVSGNTNSYRLHIRNTDFSIPVARSKGKDILDKIQELSNVLELT